MRTPNAVAITDGRLTVTGDVGSFEASRHLLQSDCCMGDFAFTRLPPGAPIRMRRRSQQRYLVQRTDAGIPIGLSWVTLVSFRELQGVELW